MTTRIIHVVRCSDPNDSSNYIDVEVTDGWVFTGPNGDQQTLDCPAASAVPGTTRVSHFVTITNPTDSSQSFEAEVLDGCVVTFWNGDQKAQQWPGQNAVSVILNASGFPSITLAEGGIASGAPPGTRVGEFTQVTSNGVQTSFDSSQSSYLIAEKCQGICFTGPNGDQFTLDFPDADEVTFDTTQYVTGPDGDPAPPPNTDPNPYIQFTGGGVNTGNALVRMGPLWRPVKIQGSAFVLSLISYPPGQQNFAPTSGPFSPATFSLSLDAGSITDTQNFSPIIGYSAYFFYDPTFIPTIWEISTGWTVGFPTAADVNNYLDLSNDLKAALFATISGPDGMGNYSQAPGSWPGANTWTPSACYPGGAWMPESWAAGTIGGAVYGQLTAATNAVQQIAPVIGYETIFVLNIGKSPGAKFAIEVGNVSGNSYAPSVTASMTAYIFKGRPNPITLTGAPCQVPPINTTTGLSSTTSAIAMTDGTWQFSLQDDGTGLWTQIG